MSEKCPNCANCFHSRDYRVLGERIDGVEPARVDVCPECTEPLEEVPERIKDSQ